MSLTQTEDSSQPEGATQKFKLGEFEGPLDLLLFLIKKSEINIYDIPIAEIVEQYLQYLEYATKKNLDNLSEFYTMAATLLYIKSKMLLPIEIDIDEEFEDPRKELVEKLIEYQKFKKLSEIMSDKEKESEFIIERTSNQRNLPFVNDDELWEEIDIWDLLQTFSSIISSLSNEQILDIYEEVTLNEKITFMNELLDKKQEILFTELIRNNSSIMEFVCAFMAILDSVKNKLITVYQNRMFGDIRIKKYQYKNDTGIDDTIGVASSDSVVASSDSEAHSGRED
ncbi:MAG: segregation/condensation protein A [Spirochaetaceae bacterium]|nr:segregation/condensation protein A [Spirochaetaceae bacterium]